MNCAAKLSPYQKHQEKTNVDIYDHDHFVKRGYFVMILISKEGSNAPLLWMVQGYVGLYMQESGGNSRRG